MAKELLTGKVISPLRELRACELFRLIEFDPEIFFVD